MTHRLPVRIYYEDTDAGGVVYYANYLRYMERGRSEWLAAHGFDQRPLWEERNVGFIVRRVELAYRRPARLDDHVEVRTSVERITRAGIALEQDVVFANDGTVAVTGRVELACIDTGTLKPRGIPDDIRQVLQASQ